MEHRWNPRLSLQGVVNVYHPVAGRLRGQLHNISIGGMSVATEATLPLNAVVTVSFAVRTTLDVSEHRLSALVVHQSNAGAGLMYLDLDPDTFTLLRRLIHTRGEVTTAFEIVPPARHGVHEPQIVHAG
jgi:hypothetical protein